MATLTYWKIDCPNDSDAYSIREKTKKTALAILTDADHVDWLKYNPVARKVTIEYRDAFDMMQQCSDENHHCWEGFAPYT